jgi:hypothetical protein
METKAFLTVIVVFVFVVFLAAMPAPAQPLTGPPAMPQY